MTRTNYKIEDLHKLIPDELETRTIKANQLSGTDFQDKEIEPDWYVTYTYMDRGVMVIECAPLEWGHENEIELLQTELAIVRNDYELRLDALQSQLNEQKAHDGMIIADLQAEIEYLKNR